MYKNSFTKTLVHIILILLIIFLFSLTRDFLGPIYSVIILLLTPLILSVYLFYAFRPIRNKLYQWTKSKNISALITFLLFILTIVVLLTVITSMIYSQSASFLQTFDLNQTIKSNNFKLPAPIEQYVPTNELINNLQSWLQKTIGSLPKQISNFVSNIGTIGSLGLLILLAFFYLLKDEEVLVENVKDINLGKYHKEILDIFRQIHETLEVYISGQITVVAILGILMFIGYKIIGIEYALSLALIAFVMDFIPFVGPFIGAAPAVLVGLTMGPGMVVKVIILTLVVQQIESNLVTPNVMGRKMDIHPFMVILVVLICMNLFGVLGALIATPLYMVIKIIFHGLQKIYYKKKMMCPIDEEKASS